MCLFLKKILSSVFNLKSLLTDNSLKLYAKANTGFFDKVFKLKDKMLFALIF